MDYSMKCGLCYLLSNNTAGLYFYYGLKEVLAENGKYIQYLEKSLVGSIPVWRQYPLEYSDEGGHQIKKKIAWLMFCTDYLTTQLSKDGAGSKPEHKRARGAVTPAPVYVVRWIRTRYAIILLLSSRAVQVIFSDTSQILFAAEPEGRGRRQRKISFWSKDGVRINTMLDRSHYHPSLVRRMRYIQQAFALFLGVSFHAEVSPSSFSRVRSVSGSSAAVAEVSPFTFSRVRSVSGSSSAVSGALTPRGGSASAGHRHSASYGAYGSAYGSAAVISPTALASASGATPRTITSYLSNLRL